MSGCAGSKHGILNDGVPLRTGKRRGAHGEGQMAGVKDEFQPKLKNLRPLIKSRAKRKTTDQPAAS